MQCGTRGDSHLGERERSGLFVGALAYRRDHDCGGTTGRPGQQPECRYERRPTFRGPEGASRIRGLGWTQRNSFRAPLGGTRTRVASAGGEPGRVSLQPCHRRCGGALTLAAGPIYRAHFRHRSDAQSCQFVQQPARAERSVLHLLLQHELRDWLDDQGYDPRLERTLDRGGRADLFIEIAAISQTIEVQLSGLSHHEWVRRTELYQGQVHRVTWLYGPEIHSFPDEEVATVGVSHLISWKETTSETGQVQLDVALGTKSRTWTRLASLQDCRLTTDGLRTPFSQEALLIHEQYLTAVEEARRQRAHAAEAEKARRRQEMQERSQRARAARQTSPRRPVLSGLRDATPPDRSLAYFLRWHRDFVQWRDQQTWE